MDQGRYQQLLQRLDAWFAEGLAKHGAVVPCRAGCTACCHGPFDISSADAELMAEGLALLPKGVRDGIRVRGELLLARIRQHAPAWGPPYALSDLGDDLFDEISESLADQPCPMLSDEGKCQVYAHRPLVCRLIGLPMLTDLGETLENGCPIQEEFPGYPELAGVPFEYTAFAQEELEILTTRPGPETTIAAVAAQS